MRGYAVLSGNSRDDNVLLNDLAYPWVLASYESSEDPRESLNYEPLLLLDSGAFTVWTQGKTVDLGDLVSWASGVIEHYSPGEVRMFNLDVIPGTINGPPPTTAERLRAATEGAENAQAIRGAGLPVIEVYHRYEPLSVLEGILERRQPGELIAFGGLVGVAGGKKGKIEFCDAAFALLRDACGWDAMVPVHGLGISADVELATRYPWWSVDSSGWFSMRSYNAHIDGRGKVKRERDGGGVRTTREMNQLYAQRKLNRWLRSSEQLTRLWENRGVRFVI